MEEITDLKDLNDTDYMLIIFKKDSLKDLTFEFIKDDFYINIFDDILYLFDRSFEMKARFPINWVDKMIRVRKE